MSSCSAARLSSGQLQNLPILPFLAPRVFAPWPEHLLRRNDARNKIPHRAVHCCAARRDVQCLWDNKLDRTLRGSKTVVKRHFYSAIALQDQPEYEADETRQRSYSRKLDFRSDVEARLDTASKQKEAAPPNRPDVFEEEEDDNATPTPSEQTREDVVAERWYLEMTQAGTADALYDSWSALTSEMKTFRWPRLAKWFAKYKGPETTWSFISGTLADTRVSADELHNMLQTGTVAVPLKLSRAAFQRIAADIFLAVQDVLNRDETLVIPRATLQFLAWHSSGESVELIHDFLKDKRVSLDSSVLFRLAFRFAQLKHPRALDLLEQADLSKGNLKRPGVIQLCSMIIEGARNADSLTKTDLSVLTRIMDLGVPLKTQLTNSLIKNAIDCGDTTAALRIYSRFRLGGQFKPDNATFMLLLPQLHDAANVKLFHEILRDMQKLGLASFSPEVAHELLLARYRQTRFFHYSVLLRLYEEQFSLLPLKELGIVGEDYQTQPQAASSEPLPLPSRAIVELMMYAFSYSNRRRIEPMIKVYRNLVRLKEEGDALFLLLARRRTPWTVILKTISLGKNSIKAWPQIIKDMESPALDKQGDPHLHPWSGQPWTPPFASNASIWNVVLNAYARQKSMAEAENILKVMAHRSIEPDIFSYTPLLAGYAALQDMAGIERTLRRIEVAGLKLEMSEHTFKALKPFKDREALAQALDESAKRRSNPYAARSADELFESDEPAPELGSAEEFERWDSFAQTTRDEVQNAMRLQERSQRRHAFQQQLNRRDPRAGDSAVHEVHETKEPFDFVDRLETASPTDDATAKDSESSSSREEDSDDYRSLSRDDVDSVEPDTTSRNKSPSFGFLDAEARTRRDAATKLARSGVKPTQRKQPGARKASHRSIVELLQELERAEGGTSEPQPQPQSTEGRQ